MKKSEIIFGALRLPIDYIASFSALLLAYYLRPVTDLIPGVQFSFGPELLPPFKEYFYFSIVAALFLNFIFIIRKQYSLKVSQKISSTLFNIIFLVTVWMMFIILYYFLVVHELFFSRIALAHIWIFSVFFILIGRTTIILIQRHLLKYGIGKRRVLLIGEGELTNRLYKEIKNNNFYEIVGTLSDQIKSTKKGEIKIIGKTEDFEQVIKKHEIEEVIQTSVSLNKEVINRIFRFCRHHQIQYQFVPDLLTLQKTNIEVKNINQIPLISLKESALDGWGYIAKRIFDYLLALIIVLFLIPIWAIIPFLIKMDSKGPIFYKSKRKYRNKVFSIYKFRSMISNADEIKKNLLAQNERSGPLFKIKNDPRITKLGKFLRKTSIDELPQLFNVLKGDLSLVGPRPHLPEEIDQYKSHHKQVFAIKPGITGLAQISGRSNLDFEDEVRLDIYYIQNWSLWLDIKIIFQSALIVFKADGS